MIFDATITPAAPRMCSAPSSVVPTGAAASWQRAEFPRPEQVSAPRGSALLGIGATRVTTRSAVLPTPIVDARDAAKKDRPPRGVPR